MNKNSKKFIDFIRDWVLDISMDEGKLGVLSVNENDCLCYKAGVNFPFARLDRENKAVIIHFHTRYKKYIMSMLEFKNEFEDLITNWIFVHTLYPEKNNHDPYDNHFDNMYNIIETYLMEPFFTNFTNNNLDLVDLLESYVIYYDCLDVFDDVCKYRIHRLLARKTYCYITGSRIDVFTEEMKVKLRGLDRKMRINSILRNLEE